GALPLSRHPPSRRREVLPPLQRRPERLTLLARGLAGTPGCLRPAGSGLPGPRAAGRLATAVTVPGDLRGRRLPSSRIGRLSGSAVAGDHPVAEGLVGRTDGLGVDHELGAPGVLRDQLQPELEILELVRADVAHG